MRKLMCVFVLILASCRANWETPPFDDNHTLPNATIGDLRTYYNGAQLTINEGIILSGRVVSSTRAGNFYNTFLIDDGTGAIEIMAGIPDLDATCHPGQQITVHGRGLAVGWRDGVMQLGLPPEPGSRYATGYFYHQNVMEQWVSAERNIAPVEPIEVRISELPVPESTADCALCGRLVRISKLRANLPNDLSERFTWATARPEPQNGYVAFHPTDGSERDSIVIVTSGYASFAAAEVPLGEGALTGILLYGRGDAGREHYLLKLRDEEDIDF